MITNTTAIFQIKAIRLRFFWVNNIDSVYYSTEFEYGYT